MSGTLNSLLIWAFLGLRTLTVFAEEKPADKPLEAPKPLSADESVKVTRLIQALADEDFSKRVAAQRELEGFGFRARDVIVAAIGLKDQDPERKARLTDVYEKLSDPILVARTEKLLKTHVTFELVDCTLKDAVSRIKECAGIGREIIFDVPETMADRPINLRVSDMEMGIALAWVCKLVDGEYLLKGNHIVIKKENP